MGRTPAALRRYPRTEDPAQSDLTVTLTNKDSIDMSLGAPTIVPAGDFVIDGANTGCAATLPKNGGSCAIRSDRDSHQQRLHRHESRRAHDRPGGRFRNRWGEHRLRCDATQERRILRNPI